MSESRAAPENDASGPHTIGCVGHETEKKMDETKGVTVLPDGSAFAVGSMPLPEDHWLYVEGYNEPPAPLRIGIGEERDVLAAHVRAAARYAIRASTMNGREQDFDPDAMVQNMIVGLLGYWTKDGRSCV